jgi:hypothetical protein
VGPVQCDQPQGLRSASQPCQSWKNQELAPETEEPLELVDAQGPLMAFPRQHTKGGETVGDMVQLRPLRVGLTDGQPELILA